MNKTINLISIILFLNCPQPDSNRLVRNSDNTFFSKGISNNILVNKKNNPVLKRPAEITDTVVKRKTGTTILLKISTEILKAIKKRDYYKLVSFIHPKYGVRFSPYAYIDTSGSRVLFSESLVKISKQHKPINWYSSWEGEPEFLTVDQYFNKYVYDVDFLNAPVKSINKFHSQGTDLNNISEVYPKCDVVEFYFPGFEKKYEGIDFRGLRLVFKLYNKTPYLVAIVHDQWTP